MMTWDADPTGRTVLLLLCLLGETLGTPTSLEATLYSFANFSPAWYLCQFECY